ncbi:M18 family aminopeptidase [Actinomarinicola tropica]|uniref:M18 family aminopeptidase n=1 Tax=Actinomarinicola tropica TaxID=2789776 RepID=A0A5Q2RN93_9ACTN|nr:M18 family aminopeptidase [Actinomarinicola tropica]QGG95370.1 M18 family aminopeptidase [Actinomarinicola tropica]
MRSTPITVPDETRDLLRFIDASPSPYHAARNAADRLVAGGFTALDPMAAWPAGVRRGVVTDGGALVAWSAPAGSPPDAPFRIVGAHTDSPNLRVKAKPDVGRAGWRQIGVEVYGGALVNSWLDRDLGISGRVAVRDGESPRGHREVLVKIDRPLLRVPQLAIHLDREINEKGLQLNKQQHLVPVWGLGARRPGELVELVADEAGVAWHEVLGWDLMLHDLTPSAVGGASDELIFAPRLDNLLSSHAGLVAMERLAPASSDAIAVLCLFDHEEVGSTTATGAAGTLLARLLEQSVAARGGDRAAFLRALSRSTCVSADMAHATHPNYAERHEPDHLITLDGGPVIKINANQRYASDATSVATFQLACDDAGVPTQRYIHRTDLACGSTIGPITAAGLAVSTVDVGVPQLSMHSARELASSTEPARFIAALTAFLSPA